MAIRARELQSIRSLLYSHLTLSLINSKRNLSTGHNHNSSDWESFRTKSAYEVLGVSQSSSFSEIKSSFRKLAKETHPDMATNSDCYNNNGDDVVGNRNSDSNNRFLQILAAYEILSDSKKRAHYDSFLYSQIKINPKSDYKMYNSCSNPSITLTKESNVVEWLKWYRLTIDDIIMHNRISNNSTYLEKLESELYTAIRSAYFGPQIESMNFLPDCFEAEERSSLETPELLHLVSGRDLFGIVYVGNNNNGIPKLPHTCEDNSIILENEENVNVCENLDLELHICGKVVATANRKRKCDCINTGTDTDTEIEDHIHVFLVPDELDGNGKGRERFLLGIISGLESSGEEGLCTVFNARGVKTHVIMKHRTLLVKHMHWYQVGNEVSICECRSRRARLPPSRYWLFEPRCYMHDIGGWYVETFGRDTKGKNVLSPRQWDSFPELTERRLHPAMYLMALAYRSLDLEEAKRRKWSVPKFDFDFVDNWYKRYFKWG
ncbi:hypothetical protein LUZ60_010163 [Juncus effusus]|nr:hypothetical protein LUZ60_010163 [Juncus effusus]